MFYYRVKIAYRGTAYRGWQAQSKVPSDEGLPTVQGTIHAVLRTIAKYRDCGIVGTSRTDAGVHARAQVAKITLPLSIDADTLMRGMNSLLPDDIRIWDCTTCASSFSPQAISSTKEYHYYFSSLPVANPAVHDVVAHVPGPLDIDRMQLAAQSFVGEHDFHNFYRRNSLTATTVRTITQCKILPANFSPMAQNVYYLRIVGHGFLKHMVRYLAATLFDVGRETVNVSDIASYLSDTHWEKKLSRKAKAHGLHLFEIHESV